jgi:hypothetical protein
LKSGAREIAVVRLESLVQLIVVEGVPVGHLDICWRAVIFVVGYTVSNCKTFEVRFENISIISVSSDVIVDVVRKIRNIDAGV